MRVAYMDSILCFLWWWGWRGYVGWSQGERQRKRGEKGGLLRWIFYLNTYRDIGIGNPLFDKRGQHFKIQMLGNLYFGYIPISIQSRRQLHIFFTWWEIREAPTITPLFVTAQSTIECNWIVNLSRWCQVVRVVHTFRSSSWIHVWALKGVDNFVIFAIPCRIMRGNYSVIQSRSQTFGRSDQSHIIESWMTHRSCCWIQIIQLATDVDCGGEDDDDMLE